MGSQPAVFTPHHSGVKSDEPFCSAMALNEDIAVAASGNAGVFSLMGPSSLMTRLMIDRAGLPEKRFVNVVDGLTLVSMAERCTAVVFVSSHNK